MKKFFLTVLFLFFLIVGGLGFFIIRSFNTDAFQKQIVESISEMTGREFNVMGATYVSWFPMPRIVMNDITLANVKGSQRAVMVRANRVGVELEWASLLKNPLVIKKIDIENPTVFLERMDETNVNWNFPFLFETKTNLNDFGMDTTRASIRVDTVSVRGGSIEYTNALNQMKWVVSSINGNLSMDTLQGPYTFNGTFRAKEKTVSAQLKIMQLRVDTAVPFSLNLVGEDNNFLLDLNGTITPSLTKTTQMVADGSFSTQKPNDLLKAFDLKPLSEALNVPSFGNMRYESANGQDTFKSFTVRFGDTENAVSMTGSLEREKKQKLSYKATINFNRFDYAQWQNMLSELNWKNLTDGEFADFKLKLHADTFVYQGKNFKNVNADFAKNGYKFQINGGSMEATGETTVNFEGGSIIQNDKVGLVLMLAGKSARLDELLKTVSPSADFPKVLAQSAIFKGNTTIYADGFNLEIQEFSLDKTKLSGNVRYEETKPLPTIRIKLFAQNVNIDDYAGYRKPKEKVSVFALINNAKNYVSQLTFLKNYVGTFDLAGNNIVFFGAPIEKITLNGEVVNNTLKITKADIRNLANASLSGSVDFSGLNEKVISIPTLKMNFGTPQLSLFMDKIGLTANEESLKDLKDFKTELTLSEQGDEWAIDMNNVVGDLGLTLDGKLKTTDAGTTYNNLQVSLSYPDFRRFSREIFDIKGINTAMDGDFLVKMVLNGSLDNVAFSDGQIKIGPNQMSVNGTYKPGKQAQLIMNIEAPSFNVNKYIWNDLKNIKFRGINAQKPFDLSVFDGLDHQIKISTAQLLYNGYELKNAILSWVISGREKTVTLKELSGTYGTSNAPFKASGMFNWGNTPTFTVDFNGFNSEVSPHLLSMKKMSYGEGTVRYQAHLESTGKSPAEMLNNLKGSGQLTFENGIWVGTGIDKVLPLVKRTIDNHVPKETFDKEMNRILNSGKTPIQKIDGAFTIENGQFKAMNTVLNGEGFISDPMQIQWDIAKDSFDILVPITLSAYADLPPFALTVRGKRDALAYQTNYVDLSSSVADIVKAESEQLAEKKQTEKEKEMKIARSEREDKIREAILSAREAVKQAGIKVTTGDNQKALYLYRNAQDALSVVNNMSVKETLTDAEYIQLTEQSRLAIMKAEEAVAEATNDKFFEDRKKLHAFSDSAQQMQSEIIRIRDAYPDIEIVQKLAPATAEHVNILQKLSDEANPNETDESHYAQMRKARDAYVKVVKGYQYVLRFDIDSNVKPIQPLSLTVPENTGLEIFEKIANSDETDADEENQKSKVVETQEQSSNDINALSADDEDTKKWQIFRGAVHDSSERIRSKISRANDGFELGDETENGKTASSPSEMLDSADDLSVMPRDLPPTGSVLRGTISRAE